MDSNCAAVRPSTRHQNQVRAAINGDAERHGRNQQQQGGERDIPAGRRAPSRETLRNSAPEIRAKPSGLPVDHPVCPRRDPREPLDERRREIARPGQREVLAAGAVEHQKSLGVEPPRRQLHGLLKLCPVSFVGSLKLERGHSPFYHKRDPRSAHVPGGARKYAP